MDRPIMIITSAAGPRHPIDPERYEADRLKLIEHGMPTLRTHTDRDRGAA